MIKKSSLAKKSAAPSGYTSVLADVAHLLEAARRASARTTNAIMTATYWEIGRRIVEHEQTGIGRAAYGELLLRRLSADLVKRFGRGFGLSNLKQIRKFYLTYANIGKGQTLSGLLESGCQTEKSQTLSGEFNKPLRISQTLSAKFPFGDLTKRFPLPWSHYVLLLSVNYPAAELRGILNALEPKTNLFIMLIPNPDKVTVIPEFPSPKFLLYLGEFSKHHLCGYAFDYLHYPRWSILRWHKQKQMHMIIHCFHRIYFKFISLCDLTKDLFQSRRHSIVEQLLSIFWYPYKMIFQIIDAMFASSQWAHSPHCNTNLILTSSGCPFHPSSRAAGYFRTLL